MAAAERDLLECEFSDGCRECNRDGAEADADGSVRLLDVVDGEPEEIFTRWVAAVDTSVQRGIDSLHLAPFVRAKLDLAFHDPKHAPASRVPKAGVELYDVFGVRLSLSQISQLPQCVVSYNTLRKRVDAGWDVHKAATTQSRPGRPKKTAS
jgi:hypothetical protein